MGKGLKKHVVERHSGNREKGMRILHLPLG